MKPCPLCGCTDNKPCKGGCARCDCEDCASGKNNDPCTRCTDALEALARYQGPRAELLDHAGYTASNVVEKPESLETEEVFDLYLMMVQTAQDVRQCMTDLLKDRGDRGVTLRILQRESSRLSRVTGAFASKLTNKEPV
jgi:hypothetical protein